MRRWVIEVASARRSSRGVPLPPIPAPARVVTDRPEKLENPVGEKHMGLAQGLRRLLENARREVVLITPYFVPRDEGVTLLRELREKGLRVVLVTNSLASTNHVAVHSGYFHHREALLGAGVELYELKVDYLAGVGDIAEPRTCARNYRDSCAGYVASSDSRSLVSRQPTARSLRTPRGLS